MISLIEALSLEEIIARNVALFAEVNPTVSLESDSDYYMPVINAWSEAELRLRIETNFAFKQFLWMSAVNDGLDAVAEMFGIVRLEGAKPYATLSFEVEPKSVDILVPNLLVGSQTGESASIESFVLPANTTTIEVVAFLDEYVQSNPIKTEQLLTTLPYLATITQLDSFANGEDVESDAALRERIKLSFADFTTAGPIAMYEKKTFEADARIKDVYVYEQNHVVMIVIDTDVYDGVMQSRVLEALGAEDARPLTDTLSLSQATPLEVQINASVTLKQNVSSVAVDTAIKNKIEMTLLKIGEKLSVAKIIDMLFVEGVEDVELLSPVANVNPPATGVVRIGTVGLSYV